ncbi:unnamed protein product [Prunus armeniaca]
MGIGFRGFTKIGFALTLFANLRACILDMDKFSMFFIFSCDYLEFQFGDEYSMSKQRARNHMWCNMSSLKVCCFVLDHCMLKTKREMSEDGNMPPAGVV